MVTPLAASGFQVKAVEIGPEVMFRAYDSLSLKVPSDYQGE